MSRRWMIVGIVALSAAGLTFALAGPATGVVIDGFFVDDNNSQFEEDIDAIAAAEITRGCDALRTRYCPNLSVTRGEMAAFLRRALDLPLTDTDFFADDELSSFEGDINAIAEAGITTGCDQAGRRYCPGALVTRGEMAAFLRRSQNLPIAAGDHFNDDQGSLFEADINAIAEAGITRGCDATGTRFCPLGAVSRGAMAAFLRRSLDLPAAILEIPIGDNPALVCSRGGQTCTLVVDLDAGRPYRIEEGLFQALPASDEEMDEFNSPNTEFKLTVDSSNVTLDDLPVSQEADLAFRRWQYETSFTEGTHTLVARWLWQGIQFQLTTVTVRASG